MLYCGWLCLQNPADSSRHRGHPSQYRPPMSCDLSVSLSVTVAIIACWYSLEYSWFVLVYKLARQVGSLQSDSQADSLEVVKCLASDYARCFYPIIRPGDTWRCITINARRTDVSGAFTVRSEPALSAHVLIGVVYRCSGVRRVETSGRGHE